MKKRYSKTSDKDIFFRKEKILKNIHKKYSGEISLTKISEIASMFFFYVLEDIVNDKIFYIDNFGTFSKSVYKFGEDRVYTNVDFVPNKAFLTKAIERKKIKLQKLSLKKGDK